MGCTGASWSPPCSPHTKAEECACPTLPLALPSILATAALGPANGENELEFSRDKAAWADSAALLAVGIAGSLGTLPSRLTFKELFLGDMVFFICLET